MATSFVYSHRPMALTCFGHSSWVVVRNVVGHELADGKRHIKGNRVLLKRARRTEQVYKLIVSCFVSRMDGKAEVSILLTKINKQYQGQDTDQGKDAPNDLQNCFHILRITKGSVKISPLNFDLFNTFYSITSR